MLTIERIKEIATPILKANHVTKAYIFGSYARGEQREDSDIDFLIDTNGYVYTLFEIADLREALENALNKPVDLVEVDAFDYGYFFKDVNKDKICIL